MQIPCWLFLRHGRRGFSYEGTAILPPDEGEGRKSRAKPRGFLQKRNPKGKFLAMVEPEGARELCGTRSGQSAKAEPKAQFWQWWNPMARADYAEPEAVSQ